MSDSLIVAINIILTLNPKPSTVLATGKKINSTPSKTRTVSEASAHGEWEVPHWKTSLGFPSLGVTTVEEAGSRYLGLTQCCNSLQLLE